MAANKQKKTYVEFILPSKTVPAGSAIVKEVEDRRISKLDIPPLANRFYFFSAPAHLRDRSDVQKNGVNYSSGVIVAEKMLTRDEAILLDPKKDWLKRGSSKREKGRTLSTRDVADIIWEMKYGDLKSEFALARNGAIIKLQNDETVIDANKKTLRRRKKL